LADLLPEQIVRLDDGLKAVVLLDQRRLPDDVDVTEDGVHRAPYTESLARVHAAA
jgi:hypothetical protein